MKSKVYVVVVLALSLAAFAAPAGISIDDQSPVSRFGKRPSKPTRLPIEMPQVGPGPVCPPSSSGCVKQ